MSPLGAGDPVGLWAEQQVTALAEDAHPWAPPEYGSSAWTALPAQHPARAAAIIEAAEQWRRHLAEQDRLDQLAEHDPIAWYREVTADAHAAARAIAAMLANQRTHAELYHERVKDQPVHQLRATPGWPPIAIPGQPGRYLTAQEAA